MSIRTMLTAMLTGLICVTFFSSALADTDTKNAVRVAGQLTKIDGKKFTIVATDGKEVIVNCTDTTKLSSFNDKPGSPSTKFEDFKVGQPVLAYYSKVDNDAFAVSIANAPETKTTHSTAPATTPDTKNVERIVGQLTKIEGKKFVITTDGKETIVTCNDATKFARDGDKPGTSVTIEAFQAGQQVRAYYSKTDNSALAVSIANAPDVNTSKNPTVTPDPKNIGRVVGQLAKIDDKKMTILASDGKEIVVTCNDATKLTRDGDKSLSPAKLEDFKIGQPLRAYYSKTDNSALAVSIAKDAATNR